MIASVFLALFASLAYVREPYVGAVAAGAAPGRIVTADGADNPAYPASVTKLMTALLVLEDVKAGKYALTDRIAATADVYKSEPSWVGLKVGETMTVGDMLTALMVESANDVAIALGVHASGSLAAFVARMNGRAAELGMKKTVYYNPNGLPPKGKKYPWKNFNVSTAADQLRLARELVVKHPEILRYTSVKTCDLVKTAGGYRVAVTRRVNEPAKTTALAEGEKLVKQMRNHNNVMVKDKLKVFDAAGREVVDGLKTGYIDAGGSSVVMTGVKGKKRVIVVVLGSKGSKLRDEHARRLLTDALDASAW